MRSSAFDSNRRGIAARLLALAGGSNRRLAVWARQLSRVAACEPELRRRSDAGLLQRSLEIRHRLRAHPSSRDVVPEAFALVREAARRTIDQRHFDVQVLGGIALASGCIAEMQTGEGKTLTATLPLFLHALAGRGAHLMTANDYLARRDAETMRPVYEALGLSVGFIGGASSADERRRAYGCDITYGTAKEFGFDFLRDRMLLRAQGRDGAARGAWLFGSAPPSGGQSAIVQRGFHFALVDEADHVLIDEARTPLVIASARPQDDRRSEACYRWCAGIADEFREGAHFVFNRPQKSARLTPDGRERVRALPKPGELDGLHALDLYQAVERALAVAHGILRDQQYVVRDGAVALIDEATGRPAEGRKWRNGIHQAVEAKEGLPLTVETGHAARMTLPALFSQYRHLAGMTGTATRAAGEFRRVYGLPVVPLPTHRPSRRILLPEAPFSTAAEKWAALVEEVRRITAAGRPVLIGTRSVEESERASNLLRAARLEHDVLNAKHPQSEAEIVAHAGEPSRIVVATNMAGRGTDIRLDERVAAGGGLHVICSELHDSSRIDRQLIGRCGRQGDPGSARVYLSLEDAVLEAAYGRDLSERIRSRHGSRIAPKRVAALLRRAQRRIERRHQALRRELLQQEQERRRMAEELGLDPYLDLADGE